MKELELIIGARVYCKNGKCGRLSKVVVDPDGWLVTHIIVEEGFLQRRSRVCPISVVQQATTGDIYLSIAEEELDTYPEYQEGLGFVELPEGIARMQPDGAPDGRPAFPSMPVVAEKVRRGTSPELFVIERGTPINYLDDAFGRLDYLLVRPGDGQITGLVLQQPAIPESMVHRIDEHGISLAIDPTNSKDAWSLRS